MLKVMRLEAVAEYQLWSMLKGLTAYTPGLQIANLKYPCCYVRVAPITTPFLRPHPRLARPSPLAPLPRYKRVHKGPLSINLMLAHR
jgi:hypothetical protein